MRSCDGSSFKPGPARHDRCLAETAQRKEKAADQGLPPFGASHSLNCDCYFWTVRPRFCSIMLTSVVGLEISPTSVRSGKMSFGTVPAPIR